MHLLGPQFNNISTRKRKSKGATITAKLIQDHTEYNKLMRKYGSPEMSMDDYILYLQGKLKPKLRGVGLPKYEVSDHRDRYKSATGIAATPGKVEKVYTGTLIRGLAVTHKSNIVPVTSQEQAEDIAKMRR